MVADGCRTNHESLTELREQIHIIVHDTNGILAEIIGNIDLAQIYMDEDKEKAARKLAEVEKAAMQMKELLWTLRSLAKTKKMDILQDERHRYSLT